MATSCSSPMRQSRLVRAVRARAVEEAAAADVAVVGSRSMDSSTLPTIRTTSVDHRETEESRCTKRGACGDEREREATDRPWRMHIRTEKPKQRRYTTNGAKSQESKGRQYTQQAAQQRSKQQAAVHAACSRHTHRRALKLTIEVASRAHTDVWLDATAHRYLSMGTQAKGERTECSCLS